MKRHVRADGEKPFAPPAPMDETDAGDDLMCAPLKKRQHPFRIGEVRRLAQNFAAEENQRVRAEHECVGEYSGDSAGLEMGVEPADFQRRQMPVRHLLGIAGNDLEIHLQMPQQLRAARRRGGKNQLRQFHNSIYAGNGNCRAAQSSHSVVIVKFLNQFEPELASRLADI